VTLAAQTMQKYRVVGERVGENTMDT
jgi:hypothetical protein